LNIAYQSPTDSVVSVVSDSYTFFSPAWLLTSWCEKHHIYRSFQLDRIQTLTLRKGTFEDKIWLWPAIFDRKKPPRCR